MLSTERNLFMTRVGRGQPMGEFFRHFWLPLTLSEQLPERDGDPVRLRLLDPVNAGSYSYDDRERLAAEVRGRIADALAESA